jgi:hypothetical protein
MSSYALEGPKWASKTITWSFAYPDQAGGLFSGQIVGAYQSVIRAAFTRWQSVADITFQEVPDAQNVDIRVGWSQLAAYGDIGQAVFTYTGGTAPTFNPGTLVRLEDPSETWVASSTTATYLDTASTLYQVALHEIGHALGLAHSTDASAVMNPGAGPFNRDLDQTDIDGIRALYSAPSFSLTDATTGLCSHPQGLPYSGPVVTLQQELIYIGQDNVAISTTVPNVFLRGGDGDDALQTSAGSNVLDGGTGSNFLMGTLGTDGGTDTFFVDARSTAPTWSTIVNFHAGDQIAIWGLDGSSQVQWVGQDGASGYVGATLRAQVNGQELSVTLAGLSDQQGGALSLIDSNVNDVPFLLITRAS